MNEKQMAAEAWKCIKNLPEELQFYDEEGQAIILAAIEKAYQAGYDEGKEVEKQIHIETERMNKIKSRAAHADVEQLRAECDHYKMLTQELGQELRAAHAREPSDQIAAAAERLRYECETTEDPNSGFAKDIMTLVEFAESGAARASEQGKAAETQCESGGNYGLCKSHPTCELIRNRIETYEKALREIDGMSWHQVGKAALYIASSALESRKPHASEQA